MEENINIEDLAKNLDLSLPVIPVINDGRLNRIMSHGFETDEGVFNSGEVLTEPGLVLTVAEILDRFTHGKPLPDGYEHNRQYTSQTGSTDVLPFMQKGYDLCDLPRVREALQRKIADANNTLDEINSKMKSIDTNADPVSAINNVEVPSN